MPRQFGKIDGSASWPACPKCRRKHEAGSSCPTIGVWEHRRTPVSKAGVVWLKRPMPPDQWPPDDRAPRDPSFKWLVRSACGHPGGTKLWAFYAEADADAVGSVFATAACQLNRCPRFIMIQNDGRRR